MKTLAVLTVFERSGYCMQDVCISFWKEDGSSDMMLKVTDVSTPF